MIDQQLRSFPVHTKCKTRPGDRQVRTWRSNSKNLLGETQLMKLETRFSKKALSSRDSSLYQPNTWEEAADLAANHFMAHNVNQTNWEGQRPRREAERYSLFRYRGQHQSYRQNSKFRGDNSSLRSFEPKSHTRPPGNQEALTPKSCFKGDKPLKQPAERSVHFSKDTFSKDSSSYHSPRGRSQIICWKCREKGHYASECTTVMRFSVPSLLEMLFLNQER